MSTRPNLTGLLPPHVVDVAARDRKITLPLGIRRIGLGEPFGDSKTGITRLRTCPRISRTAGNALAAFSFGRKRNFSSASARFPGESHVRLLKGGEFSPRRNSIVGNGPRLLPVIYEERRAAIAHNRCSTRADAVWRRDPVHQTAPLVACDRAAQWRSCFPERHWSGAVQ